MWVECHGASAQQLQACSFTEVGALSDVQQEMKEVGKDLVAHSVACGLTAVTGEAIFVDVCVWLTAAAHECV